MHTFNPKGLTQNQIEFLTECERLFMEGAIVNNELMALAFKNCAFQKGTVGTECVEAWHYWLMQKFATDRTTYDKPKRLEDILMQLPKGDKTGFYVQDRRDGTYKGYHAVTNNTYIKRMVEDAGVIYPFTPDNFFIEITEYGGLFVEYNQIIGGRLVCFIELEDTKVD